jgi:hypothetical protein
MAMARDKGASFAWHDALEVFDSVAKQANVSLKFGDPALEPLQGGGGWCFGHK